MNDDENYEMRGRRVHALNREQIENKASEFINFFKLRFFDEKILVLTLVDLLALTDKTVRVIPDKIWFNGTKGLTQGHYDPVEETIAVPASLIKRASKGDISAISVFLHEVGHMYLNHSPSYHYSDSNPTKLEDAEWQADYFAESVLCMLGIRCAQLELDF